MPQSSLKFCPFCGTDLGNLLSKAPVQQQAAAPQKARANSFAPFSNQGEDDDDSYIDRIERLQINISELDVEIGKPYFNKETIGGLMAQGPTNEEKRFNPIADPNQVIENFKKEGSAIRPKVNSRQNIQNEE